MVGSEKRNNSEGGKYKKGEEQGREIKKFLTVKCSDIQWCRSIHRTEYNINCTDAVVVGVEVDGDGGPAAPPRVSTTIRR